MRLTQYERQAILSLAKAHFGAGCVVRLFGSRVDDARRGGDIDLHLEPESAEQITSKLEIAFRSALRDALGDQKIDVVVRTPSQPPRPIDRIALREGVRL